MLELVLEFGKCFDNDLSLISFIFVIASHDCSVNIIDSSSLLFVSSRFVHQEMVLADQNYRPPVSCGDVGK